MAQDPDTVPSSHITAAISNDPSSREPNTLTQTYLQAQQQSTQNKNRYIV